MAELFALPLAQVEPLLGLLDDRSCWLLGPAPGSLVIRVPPGQRRAGGTAVLLRADGGAVIPLHRHRAEEHVLMLQGAAQDDGGRLISAGELLVSPDGSSHSLVVREGPECICGIVLMP